MKCGKEIAQFCFVLVVIIFLEGRGSAHMEKELTGTKLTFA